ncbi:MAG: phosphoenolpyruvate carboxykinase (ATP) [Candidatus Thorarchaeota archaeon]
MSTESNAIFNVGFGCQLSKDQIILDPDHKWFQKNLKPYYIVTKDFQYLFGSTQPGRRPDRAYYMVPKNYRLGKKQKPFDRVRGKMLFEVVLRYLQEEKVPVIVQNGIQGEHGYEVGLRVIISVKNMHSAYIGWFGKLMVFPPKENQEIDCWNFVVQENLPLKYVNEIRKFWPTFDPNEPMTLYDLTEMDQNRRRVMSLRVDYFGGAYKKPNLTLVWNKAESDGYISYHAGMTSDRVIKGLSGTGKTTLTVGPELEQDDACVGKLIRNPETNKIKKVQLIGLEAASYAKSQDLSPSSPEWPGLMKSREIDENGNRPVVLAQNIDCENVEYQFKEIYGYTVKVPIVKHNKQAGSLLCKQYHSSGTTNGRFIFLFSELNKDWGKDDTPRYLKTIVLSMKRFDLLDPMFRITDPILAAAFDSSVESIITSAVAEQKPGTRVRSYAATDFMAREHCHQALLKLEMYRDLGLGLDGKLVFLVINAGAIGEHDIQGNQIRIINSKGELIPKIDQQTGKVLKNELGEIIYQGQGEKITVQDTKRLLDLGEHRKITNWIPHIVYGGNILLPDPKELENKWGMKEFGIRFNRLKYYTVGQFIDFTLRDIKERTKFLEDLFNGQECEPDLEEVIYIWQRFRIPDPVTIEKYYQRYYSGFGKYYSDF